MATFYVLPSRPLLGERIAHAIRSCSGPDCSSALWPELAEVVRDVLQRHPGSFMVFQDDLPLGEDPALAIRETFGAEDSDEIIGALAQSPLRPA